MVVVVVVGFFPSPISTETSCPVLSAYRRCAVYCSRALKLIKLGGLYRTELAATQLNATRTERTVERLTRDGARRGEARRGEALLLADILLSRSRPSPRISLSPPHPPAPRPLARSQRGGAEANSDTPSSACVAVSPGCDRLPSPGLV